MRGVCRLESADKVSDRKRNEKRLQTQLLAVRIIRINFAIAAYSISEYSIGLIAF